MASIGNLHLGACEDDEGICHPTAIGCALLNPLKMDIRWSCVNGDWLVTAKKGLPYISARSRQQINFEETKRQGITAIMQALDLVCVQDNLILNLSNPSDSFYALYRDNGDFVLRFTDTLNLVCSMNTSTQVRDRDGNIVPQPEVPKPQWHRAFRYYRLSQLAADVYEAYRNLYLAFEALAESCYPRKENEREGEWVRRCFRELHTRHGLTSFAPYDHRAPNEYLFGTLYEHTRCNLFHSRTADAILPFYEIDTSKIKNAYETLLRIWRYIACAVLKVNGGGSVITYEGYHHWMDRVFGQSIAVEVTDDPVRVKDSDKSVSPGNHEVVTLSSCRYIGKIVPGVIGIEAEERNIQQLPIIHRVGLTTNNVLLAATNIDFGLNLRGVDKFQVFFNQRLIQGSQPKVQF